MSPMALQAIFNEVIFFPSHNGYVDPGVTRRVMDMYEFMNSKTLFKEVRAEASHSIPLVSHTICFVGAIYSRWKVYAMLMTPRQLSLVFGSDFRRQCWQIGCGVLLAGLKVAVPDAGPPRSSIFGFQAHNNTYKLPFEQIGAHASRGKALRRWSCRRPCTIHPGKLTLVCGKPCGL